ncbi:MAG UNVERIFIED_CONTAM: hypothetical protein LVT10_06015 [Anaerolineae bacterium]|jgi:hypothetical protein
MPELKEFGELEEAQVIVSVEEATPNKVSVKYLTDKSKQKNVDLLKDYASRPRDPNKRKEIVMRFLVSPVEAHGTDRLEQLTLVQNELIETADGQVRRVPLTAPKRLSWGRCSVPSAIRAWRCPMFPLTNGGACSPIKADAC